VNTSRLAGLCLALALLPPLLAGCGATATVGGRPVDTGGTGGTGDVGTDMYNKFKSEGAFYDDPELASYIDRIGQRLVANSDWPDYDFTFSVIDSPDINAFATPGGYIYVNRGLLAYLDNEAELAGVIAHEIGHITGRHHSRQKTANITNQVLATTAYILTGSGDLADASTMYGTELVRGFGREHELEADGYGAEYMYKAGYDPDALLEVIGVLKNQENFQRLKARSSGKAGGTYHGLYATHPRNDQRLQTVIGKAEELELANQVENPEVPGEFRRHIDGIVWGNNAKRERNRFYHNKLQFTFQHPEGWTVQTNSQAVVASAPDGSASLAVTVRRPDGGTPQQTLEKNAAGTLSTGTALDQAGLKGYTAVASNGSAATRLATIEHNRLMFMLEGKADNFPATDPELLAMIESFRPLAPREKQTGKPMTIEYIQVPRGATMASLAASLRIPYAEERLRLINGLYPRGEPRTGDWIKMIR
jgi:predicted Zn-dependent protease